MKAKREEVRVAKRLTGNLLLKVREVQELVSLNSEGEAFSYLAQRGLEAMSGQLNNMKLTKSIEDKFSPQELMTFMLEKDKVGEL